MHPTYISYYCMDPCLDGVMNELKCRRFRCIYEPFHKKENKAKSADTNRKSGTRKCRSRHRLQYQFSICWPMNINCSIPRFAPPIQHMFQLYLWNEIPISESDLIQRRSLCAIPKCTNCRIDYIVETCINTKGWTKGNFLL